MSSSRSSRCSFLSLLFRRRLVYLTEDDLNEDEEDNNHWDSDVLEDERTTDERALCGDGRGLSIAAFSGSGSVDKDCANSTEN